MAMEKWCLGLDIGGTKILFTQIIETGKIHYQKKIDTNISQGFDSLFKQILDEIQHIIDASSIKPQAIGIGIAGQINLDESYLKRAPNLNWSNIPIKKIFTELYGVPTVVVNDVRAATWGEWMYGAGRGVQDFLCIMIGTGIGGGIVAQNRLIKGSSGAAGELGHFPIDLAGPLCSCGNKGCLEAIASGWAIAFQAKEAVKENYAKSNKILSLSKGKAENITSKEVLRAALEGDLLAGSIITKAMEAIVAACVGFTNVFNPSRILIAGGLGQALPNLCERIQHGIKSQSLEAVRGVEVLYTELKELGVAIGAASYAMAKTEGPENLQSYHE